MMGSQVVGRLHTPSITVDCPQCDENMDIFEMDYQYERNQNWLLLAGVILNQTTKELEITCPNPECRMPFVMHKVEY